MNPLFSAIFPISTVPSVSFDSIGTRAFPQEGNPSIESFADALKAIDNFPMDDPLQASLSLTHSLLTVKQATSLVSSGIGALKEIFQMQI